MGVFGGFSEAEGVYDGSLPPTITQDTTGSFYGGFVSVELTPPSPPRRAPIFRVLDPEVKVSLPPAPAQKPREEPTEPVDPLAAYTGAGGAMLLLAALIRILPTLLAKPPTA